MPGAGDATPQIHMDAQKKLSRWDATPQMMIASGMATPMMTNIDGTPVVGGMATPMLSSGDMTPEQFAQVRLAQDIDERNKPWTDDELDSVLPSEGYVILTPPDDYVPKRAAHMQTPMLTPSMLGSQSPAYYQIPGMYDANVEELKRMIPQTPDGTLPSLKPEDMKHFGKLLEQDVDEDMLSPEERNERLIMRLLLRIKNGTPLQRKQALRVITDRAVEFGAGPLFNQILSLLMSPTLEDHERHMLVKVIDRVLYKLDDLVRPYVHKILEVIEPLLIDQDYYARASAREIISNLAKAAGLTTMIASMRPDIDHVDEYVRNTTARAFAVVASALGISNLLPFLKAVTHSKKSWYARHTGIKVVQQIAILVGIAILPHLNQLVEIVEHGLEDQEPKVRTMTALALSALAEAAAPYGIESFDSVLKPLWLGIHKHRGKPLAAFLKAIGYIIPLMNSEHANHYTRHVMDVVIREFTSTDDEMKKIVLKVIKQCVSTEGVEPAFVSQTILPPFLKAFWTKRMALDRRNYNQVVETTVELAQSIGGAEIIEKIVTDLKDESEPFRRMTLEVIREIVSKLGAADISPRVEELLLDGCLFAFQEQQVAETGSTIHQDNILNGFGAIVNALGVRIKPYLPQICGMIKWRLNNKNPRIRQQSADLIGKIAPVMMTCSEEQMLGHMGHVLYELLGEEYPEVLGSILGALKSIVTVIGMEKMNPPIRDLLPRLTPILKNRNEKVMENCIELVGRIADRGPDYVPAKEWLRLCFDMLELLRANKKSIRRATTSTFGFIARAISPQDVLVTLLNNLRVQERQNRVCTTIAIAIIAEQCAPFTVIPALMTEYRVPELNVRNGVLKSLSFLFEYIGEMGKDYIYAVTPLLEDALTDRDHVHRQTACTVVKHMALGCVGLDCEDALTHLLNLIWPNIFETQPHVINAVMEAIEALRVALGPGIIMQYTMQGLFHPSRKVRNVYWKIYNMLYIGSQDGMIPSFPRFDDETILEETQDDMDWRLLTNQNTTDEDLEMIKRREQPLSKLRQQNKGPVENGTPAHTNHRYQLQRFELDLMV